MTTDAPPLVPAPATALRGRLGPVAIMFMVIAAAAPLTVVGGLVPVGLLLGNGLGVPAMFLAAAGILLLFSVGLMALVRRIPETGTFSSYIGAGLGARAGSAAAGLALVCYTSVQGAVFSFLGATLSSSVAAVGGPDLHWTVYTLASIALVGLLGYRRIELSSRVLVVVLLAEVGIILALGVVVIATGGAEGLDASPFAIDNILSGSPALGLMFALAGFIGFESTVVYRGEAARPDRTIPLATYGSAIVVGVFYAFASWVIIMAAGPSGILAEAGEDPATLLTRLTDRYLGPVGSVIVGLLFLGSMFAAVLSLHNVITRYQHNLAERGLAPAALARVHRRHGSPFVSCLVQVGTAIVLLVVVTIAGITADQFFAWGAGIGSLAITVLMATTCVSVIRFLRREPGETTLWQRLIAPGLGALGLLAAAALTVANFPLLIGDVDAVGEPAWGVASIAVLAFVAAAPIAGLVLGARRRAPESTPHPGGANPAAGAEHTP